MPPMKFIVVWLVAVSISIWPKGYAQSYYDLYSNKEVYRAKNNQIIALDDQSPISIQTESSSSAAAASIVGHASNTSTAKASTAAVLVLIVFVAAGVVGITLWLLHLMRKRKRSKLQKDLGMTNQDTHLSGSAITNDPYKSLSTRNSFNIPMPEDAKQTKQPLAPELSVTSPTGMTTQLEIP